MKKYLLFFLIIFGFSNAFAQQTSIDGRLQPLLQDFFEQCDQYGIPYHEKLFKLKKIAVVEHLKTTPTGSILGKVERNEDGEVENIVINWVATLDAEILRIVAFHEFGHYFLDYHEHVCNDCGIIMARINSSYFEIAKDWKNQQKLLFENSPIYKNLQNNQLTSVFEPEG